MNFRQLEYFTTAARLKSISKAAQELHVAQPPVSRQIGTSWEYAFSCVQTRE